MINTNKVIGFYTDVFGNEIDEYEQVERYTVCYEGSMFYGDKDGWNEIGCDRWEDAESYYYQLHEQGIKVYVKDNEYGVYFENEEWN